MKLIFRVVCLLLVACCGLSNPKQDGEVGPSFWITLIGTPPNQAMTSEEKEIFMDIGERLLQTSIKSVRRQVQKEETTSIKQLGGGSDHSFWVNHVLVEFQAGGPAVAFHDDESNRKPLGGIKQTTEELDPNRTVNPLGGVKPIHAENEPERSTLNPPGGVKPILDGVDEEHVRKSTIVTDTTPPVLTTGPPPDEAAARTFYPEMAGDDTAHMETPPGHPGTPYAAHGSGGPPGWAGPARKGLPGPPGASPPGYDTSTIWPPLYPPTDDNAREGLPGPRGVAPPTGVATTSRSAGPQREGSEEGEEPHGIEDECWPCPARDGKNRVGSSYQGEGMEEMERSEGATRVNPELAEENRADTSKKNLLRGGGVRDGYPDRIMLNSVFDQWTDRLLETGPYFANLQNMIVL